MLESEGVGKWTLSNIVCRLARPESYQERVKNYLLPQVLSETEVPLNLVGTTPSPPVTVFFFLDRAKLPVERYMNNA